MKKKESLNLQMKDNAQVLELEFWYFKDNATEKERLKAYERKLKKKIKNDK